MSMSRSYYRTYLLLQCTEKNISNSTINAIMNLFGRLKSEQKESIAQKAIPIVQRAKTEKEAYNKIKQLIEQA